MGNVTILKGQNCIFLGGGITGNVAENGGSLILSGATGAASSGQPPVPEPTTLQRFFLALQLRAACKTSMMLVRRGDRQPSGEPSAMPERFEDYWFGKVAKQKQGQCASF